MTETPEAMLANEIYGKRLGISGGRLLVPEESALVVAALRAAASENRPKDRLLTLDERLQKGIDKTAPKDPRPWIDRLRDDVAAPSSVLTREEAAEAAKAIRNGMNPATPAMFFPQGWNVILDKLDAIALGAPASASRDTISVPRATLEKWKEAISPFWFSGNGEDEWNNEEIIELDGEIAALLRQPEGRDA